MPSATGLESLVRRFPDRAARLWQLHSTDEKFRAICADYDDALRALQHWSHSNQASATRRVEDYRDIVQELEGEVLTVLKARTDG